MRDARALLSFSRVLLNVRKFFDFRCCFCFPTKNHILILLAFAGAQAEHNF